MAAVFFILVFVVEIGLLYIPSSTMAEGTSSNNLSVQSPPGMTGSLNNAQCRDEQKLCPSDRSQYNYLYTVLPQNDLRVVLVSNVYTEFSGAILTVSTGSFDDSDNFFGLAHLCEHMLYLGNKKYPPNALEKYIENNRGVENGITDNQYTSYFYAVNSEKFEHSLDIFSQLFISPLFDNSYLHREISVVHEEYCIKTNSDRINQLLRHVSSRNHPFHQFDIGNLDTLNKSGVRNELIKFFEQRYSSNVMNLVVYDNKNLSEMLDNVIQYFSHIPNKNIEPSTFKGNQPFTGYLGRVVVYQLKSSADILSVYWQLPSLQQHTRHAVGKFLTRYLEHQGEGSIFNYLYKRGLAKSLTAGVLYETDSFCLFHVSIILLNKGMEEVNQVLKVVFEFINIFKAISVDEFDQLWDDFISVNQLMFDYKEEVQILDFISDISNAMRINPKPVDILQNPKVYTKDYKLVQYILGYFTPANSLIMLGTRKVFVAPVLKKKQDFKFVREDVKSSNLQLPVPVLDLIESYYSTPFTIYKIPSVLLEYWSSTEGYQDLHLAGPNSFLFNVHNIKYVEVTSDEPVIINNQEGTLQMVTKTVNQNMLKLRCELANRIGIKTVQDSAMSLLYLAMVRYKLRSLLYSAKELKYNFILTSSARGVEFELEGYNDANILLNFINVTLRTLLNENNELQDSVAFNHVLEAENQALRDDLLDLAADEYTEHYLQSIVMDRPTWRNNEILESLIKLDLDTVLEYGKLKLLNDLTAVCLISGSIEAEDSTYFHLVWYIFYYHLGVFPIAEEFSSTRVKLKEGVEYGLVMPTLNSMDPNSVVYVLFQVGSICEKGIDGKACTALSVEGHVNLLILHNIMMNECYHQLRVKEGLGYVAYCKLWVKDGMGSFRITVQSECFSANHIIKSINSLLENVFHKLIMAYDFKDYFKTIRKGVRQKIHYLTTNFADNLVWKEFIKSGVWKFNLRSHLLRALKKVDENSFRIFYMKHILNAQSRKKLTIVTYGQGKEVKLDVDCYIIFDRISQTDDSLDSSCR